VKEFALHVFSFNNKLVLLRVIVKLKNLVLVTSGFS